MTALAAEAHDVRRFDVGYTPDRRVLARAREDGKITVRDGPFAVYSVIGSPSSRLPGAYVAHTVKSCQPATLDPVRGRSGSRVNCGAA
jgi:hypothetical protein